MSTDFRFNIGELTNLTESDLWFVPLTGNNGDNLMNLRNSLALHEQSNELLKIVDHIIHTKTLCLKRPRKGENV